MIDDYKLFLSHYPIHRKKILIGLSGGVDSTFLLHVLNECRTHFGYELQAVHCDHMLRGEESRLDALFCKNLCKKYKIPLYLKRENVKAFAKNQGMTLEEGAREFRYRVFNAIMKKGKIDILALAHHRDDVLETMLFRLFRGTNIFGLRCMEVFEERKDYILFRPLLHVSKSDIVLCANHVKLIHREDASNASTLHKRNEIRLKVMPLLTDVFKDTFPESLLKFRDQTGECLAGIHAIFDQQFGHGFVIFKQAVILRLQVLKAFNAWMLCEYLKYVLKKTGMIFMIRHESQVQEIYRLAQSPSGKFKNIPPFRFYKDVDDLCIHMEDARKLIKGGLSLAFDLKKISKDNTIESATSFEDLWQVLILKREVQFRFAIPLHIKRWRSLPFHKIKLATVRDEVERWFKYKKLPKYLHAMYPVIVTEADWVGSPGLGWKRGLVSRLKEDYVTTFRLTS